MRIEGVGTFSAFERRERKSEYVETIPNKGSLIMKTYRISLVVLAGLLTGCVVRVRPYGVAVAPVPPPVVVEAPGAPPAVAYVPDSYIWDGYEYVGLYGDQYVYWNGGAWLMCDPVILGRFHGWERYHPAWRSHAIPYHRGRDPHR